MTKRKSKKIKATELFLSLGLVATLATACGEPAEDGGEAIEGDGTTTEEPAEATTEEMPGEESEYGEGTEEGAAEEGEGGEGGEG